MNQARVGLAVVEAAYRLELPRSEWLAELARAARPLFDDGFGVLAMTFEVGPQGELRYTSEHVGLGIPAEIREIHGEFAATIRPSEVGLIHANPAIVLASHSQLAKRYGAVRPPSELPQAARLREVGIRDTLGAKVLGPSGEGCLIASYLRTERVVRPAEETRWRMVMAHVAAAMRLRDALFEGNCDAILDIGGRILHAEGEARFKTARDALRCAATAIDYARSHAGACDPDGALQAWRGLVSGRWSLVDRFDHDGRRFLVARRNEPPAAGPRQLSMREQQVLAYAALGFTNKHISYVLGLAPSTVSTHLRTAMRRLGVRRRATLAEFWYRPVPEGTS